MPASGYAIYLSDTESGVRVFDLDNRRIGEFDGLLPQAYYGPADGVVVQREDGLWLARPGANELVSTPLRHSSRMVLPGWQPSGPCHTNPEQPLVAICGREIQVRDSKGSVEATIHAPNLPAGRWIGASLSPDGEWVARAVPAGTPVQYPRSSMVTFEDVQALAVTLPRTEEAVVRGRFKFRVGRIVYLAFSSDETLMGFAFPKDERDALIASEPHKFMMPKQSDQRYNWVVVRLASIDRDEMHEIVLDAWRMVVPKRVAAAYNAI